jgi:hypothetical protein
MARAPMGLPAGLFAGHDVMDQAVDLDISEYKVAAWERPERGD